MNILKTITQDASGLTILSFFIAVLSWLFSFLWKHCSDLPSLLSGIGGLIGAIALIIALLQKRLKQEWLAIPGAILGILGWFLLVTFC